MKKGFTLIELLIVVLIIGILAAVALPQYRKSVDKAKIARYIPLGKALADAQDRYYLANGERTISISDLDISFPNGWTIAHGPRGFNYFINGSVRFLVKKDIIMIDEMDISNAPLIEFYPKSISDKDFAGKIDCCGEKGKYGAELCKTFGKYSEAISDDEYDCYLIE